MNPSFLLTPDWSRVLPKHLGTGEQGEGARWDGACVSACVDSALESHTLIKCMMVSIKSKLDASCELHQVHR